MAGAARRSGSTRPFRNFRMEFAYRNAPKPKPDSIPKWKIVRGDVVEILSGRDRGKQGKVVKVDRRKNGLFVEGLNMVNRTMKASGDTPGGVFKVEAPIHYSNVNLVDPVSKKPTRVAMRFLDDGTKVRVSKRSGTIIPKPEELKMRKVPRPSQPGPADTPPEEATRETWQGLEAEYQRLVLRRQAHAEATKHRRIGKEYTGSLPDPTRYRAPFGKPKVRMPPPAVMDRLPTEEQEAIVAAVKEQKQQRRTPRKGWLLDELPDPTARAAPTEPER